MLCSAVHSALNQASEYEKGKDLNLEYQYELDRMGEAIQGVEKVPDPSEGYGLLQKPLGANAG
jgi:hypothetical protein